VLPAWIDFIGYPPDDPCLLGSYPQLSILSVEILHFTWLRNSVRLQLDENQKYQNSQFVEFQHSTSCWIPVVLQHSGVAWWLKIKIQWILKTGISLFYLQCWISLLQCFPTHLKSSKTVEIWGCYEQKADAWFFEFQCLPGILQMEINEPMSPICMLILFQSASKWLTKTKSTYRLGWFDQCKYSQSPKVEHKHLELILICSHFNTEAWQKGLHALLSIYLHLDSIWFNVSNGCKLVQCRTLISDIPSCFQKDVASTHW